MITTNGDGNTGTGLGQAGDILFTDVGTVDSEAGETNDLTLRAGTGTITFNANIGTFDATSGTGTRVGAFTVEDTTGTVTFGGSDNTATDSESGPVTAINTDGSIDIGAGTNDDDEVSGGIVFNGGDLASDVLTITTSSDNVRLNGPVRLRSDLTITTMTGAGNIEFTDAATIDSEVGEANDLSLTSGTGTIDFNGNIGTVDATTGSGTRIGTLTVSATTGTVTFGGADVAASNSETANVTTVNTDGAINIGIGSDVVTGGIVINGGASVQTISTSSDAIRFNGPVTLNSDLLVDTDHTDDNTSGGSVTFTQSATIDSQASGATEGNDLTIDAGTSSVLFNASIGAGANGELGRLVIDEADAGVTFGQSDTDLGAGSTGFVTAIELVGDGTTANALDIGAGDVIGGTGIVFNGGTAAGLLTIETTTDAVRFNGAVELQTDVRIDTDVVAASGAEVGNVLFTNDASIDSQVSEANDLVIDAGAASVFFNEDIGHLTNGELGRLVIEQADTSVVFGQADDESGLDTGPVQFIELVGDGTAANALDVGSLSEIGVICFNAGPDNDNAGADDTLLVQTTGDNVRLNGAVVLKSDLRIDTDSTDANGEGGNVLFTQAATIDSDGAGSTEANGLLVDAGTASVFFNANVGAAGMSELGSLIVQEADSGVTFGGADAVSGDDGTVTTINIIGDGSAFAFDLGSLEQITGTGITLNGGGDNDNSGADSTLTLTTFSEAARFNGAVTLNSDVRIDTDDDDADTNAGGGDVLFTRLATIDSQDDGADTEANRLVIDAGSSSTLFNANIGVAGMNELGSLIVEESDG